MNRLLFFCTLIGTGGIILNASAGDIENKLQLLMPEGVSLGMRQDELQVLRPKAKHPAFPILGSMRTFRESHGLSQSENVITNLPLAVLYEADLEMPSLIHEYYFVGDQLRAVRGSVSYLEGTKDKGVVTQVLNKYSARMVQQPDVTIIAADSNFLLQTVTFSQWKDEQTGKVLLFFDSPEGVFPGGTQVIVFDSKYFGRKDFFLEPDDLPKITPLYDQLRKNKVQHDTRMQGFMQKTEGD